MGNIDVKTTERISGRKIWKAATLRRFPIEEQPPLTPTPMCRFRYQNVLEFEIYAGKNVPTHSGGPVRVEISKRL